jgi:hypothetical protein
LLFITRWLPGSVLEVSRLASVLIGPAVVLSRDYAGFEAMILPVILLGAARSPISPSGDWEDAILLLTTDS